MKQDPMLRMMTLFALVSVMGLIFFSVFFSLDCPYPLTVVRIQREGIREVQQNPGNSKNDNRSMKEYVKTNKENSERNSLEEGNKSASESSTQNFPMDINQASAEDLMQVEGIGEKRAQSILTYREKKGKITSMDDLLEIDGIGQTLFSRLCEKFYAI